MLNLAGVRPGGRYLVVDEASGILVAGVLDRLGGNEFLAPNSAVVEKICAQDQEGL